MNRACTTPQTPGISREAAPQMAMMQVEVPTTFTTSPAPHARADGVPMRVEGARPESGCRREAQACSAQSGVRWPAIWSDVAYVPSSFSRTPARSGSTATRKSSGGKPPEFVPHPFVAHGADGALDLRRIAEPVNTAAAISQCSSAVAKRERFAGLWRSQCSSFEKPHSEE